MPPFCQTILTHLDLGQSYIWNGEIFHGESKSRIDFNLLYPLPSSVSIMYCRHNSPSPPIQRKYRGRFGEKCLYGNNLAYYQWGSCFGTVCSFSTGFYSPIQSLPGRNRVTVIIQKKNSLITSNSKDSYLDSQHYVFQGSLFQHRFLEQLNVTKIWSLHLSPIYLPAIVVIGKYRVFSV